VSDSNRNCSLQRCRNSKLPPEMETIPSLMTIGTGKAYGPGTESHGLDWPVGGRDSQQLRRTRPYLLASGIYVLLSLIIWSHLWTGHPASMATCGCGDMSASIWYTSWPAYAISHGLNPLYSSALGYPTGVNLIFATYGIVMTPFTWLFGPIVSLNIILTVSPVLSALAMFALVRRWVSWTPAAFVAGLWYGFSPFVLTNLSSGHVDLGMVAIPPLVVMCLDELLIRQRRRPVAIGCVLGLLFSVQFLVGTEVLIMTLIEVAIGIAILIVFAAYRKPVHFREKARRAAIGCLASVVTALVLLAYPTWFALAGPAHFSGSLHPGLSLSSFEGSVHSLFLPMQPLTHGSFSSEFFRIVGGYQGPVLSSEYFGVGVVAACLAGLIVWRRDRLMWFFGALSLASLFLATSAGSFLAGLPVLRNIVPLHFVLLAYLSVAVVLGVVVDHTRTSVGQAVRRQTEQTPEEPSSSRQEPLERWAGSLIALAVAALAIAFPAAYFVQGIPITVEPIVIPTWFRTVAPRLPTHLVVLALPAPFTVTEAGLTWQGANGETYPLAISEKEAAMTWQALGGQRYSIVGPGGLGAGVSHRAGENQGQNVITQVTFAYGTRPNVNSSDIAAVHRALSEWGVTTVVLPDQPELPPYDQVASVPEMAALITAATGARPVHIADAWVWRGVDRDVPASFADATQFARCTAGPPGRGAAAVDRTTSCVLTTSMHAAPSVSH
jgi:hypothetical protein